VRVHINVIYGVIGSGGGDERAHKETHTYTYIRVRVCVCVYVYTYYTRCHFREVHLCLLKTCVGSKSCGLATVSRIDEIISLFCRI